MIAFTSCSSSSSAASCDSLLFLDLHLHSGMKIVYLVNGTHSDLMLHLIWILPFLFLKTSIWLVCFVCSSTWLPVISPLALLQFRYDGYGAPKTSEGYSSWSCFKCNWDLIDRFFTICHMGHVDLLICLEVILLIWCASTAMLIQIYVSWLFLNPDALALPFLVWAILLFEVQKGGISFLGHVGAWLPRLIPIMFMQLDKVKLNCDSVIMTVQVNHSYG